MDSHTHQAIPIEVTVSGDTRDQNPLLGKDHPSRARAYNSEEELRVRRDTTNCRCHNKHLVSHEPFSFAIPLALPRERIPNIEQLPRLKIELHARVLLKFAPAPQSSSFHKKSRPEIRGGVKDGLVV